MMQTLKLADDLFEPLLNGTKRGTVRNGKRDIVPGTLIFESADGTQKPARVQVSRVSLTEVHALTIRDAQLDGHERPDDLIAALHRFYPSLAGTDLVTVIEFGTPGAR